MTDLKPCPFCGGEANVKMWCEPDTPFLVMCESCKASVMDYPTEAEAIEAWNRRVDDHFRDATKMIPERTAKVMDHKYRSGTSLNIVGEPTICYEYLCGACKKKVLSGDVYCSHCGAKLDWSER